MGASYEHWLVAKGNVFAPGAAAVVRLVDQLRKEKWIVDAAKAGDLERLRFRGPRDRIGKATGGYAVRTVANKFGGDLTAKIAGTTEAIPAALTESWLDDPSREEVRLVWPVDADAADVSGALKYPLTRAPEGAVRYTLEVHRAPEYVYPISETIESVPTECACGEDLAFEWDEEELVCAFGAATGIFAECEECSRTFDPSKGMGAIANPFDGTKEEVRGGAAYRFALKIDCGESFVADPKLALAPELVALVERELGRSFYQFGSRF
jgi:hypothetical protein